MVMIFIVIIIGGLGSVGGCFIGALLMALVANYAGFLAPKVALVSNIILMIAILLWRPGRDVLQRAAKEPHMLNQLLSGDLPRSRALTAALLLVFLGLALAPFLTSGARPLNTAATICVYIVLVASYDLLLGYTGIVSFAHTMFFGIGAYGVGLALADAEPTWGAHFRRRAAGAAADAGAGTGGRPVRAARARHLLRHDHAGRGVVVRGAGVAAVGLHRRRGRQDLQRARAALARASRCWKTRSSGARSTAR